MTIERESRRSDVYLGDGRNTLLPFGFKVFLPTEIAVVLNENGVERTLSHEHGCTVSLNAEQDVQPGGTVRLDAPLPSGSKAVVLSNVRPLQQVDLTNQGGFYPDVLNAVHDRLTMLIQQLMELQARTPQVPATDTVTGKELARQIVELSRSLPGIWQLLTSDEMVRLLAILEQNPQLRPTELSSEVNSEREDVAATSKAVKTTYDKAVAAESAAANAEGAVNNVNGKLATKLDTSVFNDFKGKAATKEELEEKVGNLKNQLGGENYRHQMFTASSTFTPPKAGVRLWVLEVDGGKSGGNGSGNWVSGNGGNAGDWRYYQVISTGAQVNVLVGASNSASSVSFSEPKQQMYVFAGARGGMGGYRGTGGIGARPTSIPVVPILNCPVSIIPGGMGAALYSGEAGGGYGGHGLIIDGHNSVRAGNGLGVNQDRNYYAGDGVGGYGYGAGGGGGGGASSNSLIGRGGNGAGGCVLIWWREE